MAIEKKYPYIIGFDVETEGFDCKYHKIIEIGSVKVDYLGNVIDTFSKFGYPGRKLDKKITEITGIDDDMLINADFSDDVVREWMSWVEPSSILIAHNARFDVGFITRPFIVNNEDFPDIFVVDTLSWSKSCFSNLKKHQLGTLLEHTGYVCENLHRAFDDAKGALNLAAHMMKKCHNPATPDDMYSYFRLYGRSLRQYMSKGI